ncbi:hypothetical protein DDZ18_10660 [Marinicauda salina]|uniref:Resolvase HTH domain-containing protein n=1 Tax=Marinicauda salina TaxID=2135793 RepID=A0A2U2BRM0_9PROT|nr:hypothetical protein DDZ18_10660 [Marinicauda salina]
MPGRPRSTTERARLEARARRMREAGREMNDIVRATGVAGSTLYRWAAENRWRACDLVAEAEAASEAEPPLPISSTSLFPDESRGPESEGLGHSRSSSPGSRLSPGKRHLEEDAPDPKQAAAEHALGLAMTLARTGRLREAEAAMRLADRFARAAADPPMTPEARAAKAARDKAEEEESLAAARAELEARLDRLAAQLRAEEGAAEEE